MRKSLRSGAPAGGSDRRPVRITISVVAANDPDAHDWLDRIVTRIEDGWHVWDTDELDEADAMEATSWFRDPGRQGRRLRELLTSSIRRGAWSLEPHGRHLRVTMLPTSEDELSPEEASRLADEPLVLLVENRGSDGAFLKRVVTELDPSLHRLWQRDGDPIRVDSVGGAGQMPQEVKRRASRGPSRGRLVAITDSDRKGPGDSPGQTARELRRVCEDRGIASWVLAKREAENYLPRVLLDAKPDAGPEHARRVEAWDHLSEDQKDFFDMKHGLANESSSAEESLLAGVSRDDRARLANGFGPRVDTCWSLWSVQARSELRARGRGDLEHGLALIRSQV